MTTGLIERRIAEKARHRAAILASARALVDEREGSDFSVDELASRAGVARRTIFNHFASLDDVLLTACEEALSVVVDDFIAHVSETPVGAGSRASVFAEIADAFRTADLPDAIETIVRLVGIPGDPTSRADVLTQTAFSRAAAQLLHEVVRRNPDADPLDAELLVSSLMNGVVVIAKHWITQSPSGSAPRSRQHWDELLTRLLDGVGDGYTHTH